MKKITKKASAGFLAALLIVLMMPVMAFAKVNEGDVCKIGNTGYATLAAAIEEVQNGETIEMLYNSTISSAVNNLENKTFTIDLKDTTLSTTKDDAFTLDSTNLTVKNGEIRHSIASGTAWEPFYLKGVSQGSLTLNNVNITSTMYSVYVSNSSKNKTVTIENCNFTSTEDSVIFAGGADTSNVLDIKGASFSNSNTTTAVLQIAVKATIEDVIITSTSATAVVCYENTDLLVKGTKNSFIGAKGAIATNGSKDLVQITIEGGTFKSTAISDEDGIAFYHPDGSPLTIKGGTFEGATALYVKGGTIDIKGGTFIGTGEYNVAQKVKSGAKATGDAVVIEASNYLKDESYKPAWNPSVSISGGCFKSINGSPIAYYTFDEAAEAHQGKMISGGYFNKDIARTCIVDGYCCIDTPKSDPNQKEYPYMIGTAAIDEDFNRDSNVDVPEGAEEGVADAVKEEALNEILGNTAVTEEGATNINDEKIQEALEDAIKKTIESSELKITVMSVETKTEEKAVDAIKASTITTTSAKYDVKPWVSIIGDSGEILAARIITNEELEAALAKNPKFKITFRLAIPESMTGDYVAVSHYPDDEDEPDWTEEYQVLGTGANRYVELSATSFSVYEVAQTTHKNPETGDASNSVIWIISSLAALTLAGAGYIVLKIKNNI